MRDTCLDTAEIQMAVGNVGTAGETASDNANRGGPAARAVPEGGVDMPPEEFRAAGYDAIDRLVAYYATLSDRPVFPLKTPVDLAPDFDLPVPEHG